MIVKNQTSKIIQYEVQKWTLKLVEVLPLLGTFSASEFSFA
jgi:hypothetical protein